MTFQIMHFKFKITYQFHRTVVEKSVEKLRLTEAPCFFSTKHKYDPDINAVVIVLRCDCKSKEEYDEVIEYVNSI